MGKGGYLTDTAPPDERAVQAVSCENGGNLTCVEATNNSKSQGDQPTFTMPPFANAPDPRSFGSSPNSPALPGK